MEASRDFSNVPVFTGEIVDEPLMAGLPVPAAPMLQTKTQYHTAVMVQRPRDLDKVVKAVMREAVLAGEAFYWHWPVKVKDKKTGKYETKTLDGPSIGLAMCVAREWTNVAVPVDYTETLTHDVFTAHFVDLERGFTISRIWKQRKGANKNLDSYGDRAENMTFQAAQSRAIRNAVLAGVPKWLVDQAKEAAKEAVLKKITPEKLAAARATILGIMKGWGVDEPRIVAVVGVPMSQWGPEEIVLLKGMSTQIREGQATADELFPPLEAEQEPEGKKAPGRPKKPQDPVPEQPVNPAPETPTTAVIDPQESAEPTADELLANLEAQGWPLNRVQAKLGVDKAKDVKALAALLDEVSQ